MISRRSLLYGAMLLPWAAQSVRAWGTEDGQKQLWPIGFAPPIATPLFCATQTRVRSGRAGEITLNVERRFEFQHFGRGFRLMSIVTEVSDNAPPRLSRMVRGMIDPLVGLNIGFTIDASGRFIEVEDPPRIWDEIISAIVRLEGLSGADADRLPMFQNIATLDDTSRRALLLNEVSDLMRYAGRGDVLGQASEDNMVVVEEPQNGPWRVSATVNSVSGLCWQMEKACIETLRPRHGIVGSTMQLRL